MASGPCLSGVLPILPWLQQLAWEAVVGVGFPFPIYTFQYVKTFGKAEERREVKRWWEGHKRRVKFADVQWQGEGSGGTKVLLSQGNGECAWSQGSRRGGTWAS